MSLEITSFSVDEMLFYEYVDNMNKNVIQKNCSRFFTYCYITFHINLQPRMKTLFSTWMNFYYHQIYSSMYNNWIAFNDSQDFYVISVKCVPLELVICKIKDNLWKCELLPHIWSPSLNFNKKTLNEQFKLSNVAVDLFNHFRRRY